MYIVQILFISLVLLFFWSLPDYFVFLRYLPDIQQQHNYTQVKRSLCVRSLFFFVSYSSDSSK